MKTSINQSILRGALVAVGLFAGTAHAGYITGVTSTSSVGVYQGLNYGIAHTTDGSASTSWTSWTRWPSGTAPPPGA